MLVNTPPPPIAHEVSMANVEKKSTCSIGLISWALLPYTMFFDDLLNWESDGDDGDEDDE